MTDDPHLEQTPQEAEQQQTAADEPLPSATDPGGAHAKGYSADSAAEPSVPDRDPVPLAEGPTHHPAVHVPERDDGIQPTGRSKPSGASSGERLLGSGG